MPSPKRNNRQVRRLFPALLFVILTSRVGAQQADPALLTLDRIYQSGEFSPKSYGEARWQKDGQSYLHREASASGSGGQDIVQVEAATGKRTVLVAADKLIPSGAKTPLAIGNFDFSQDGRKLLVFTNTQRVWRQNTRGDYWVLDRDTNKLRKLGGDAKPSTLMFAHLSPDGTRVGYVRENNLYVESVKDGKITRLTKDGSATLINGTSDWVNEEELELRDAWRWSPDGQAIAYWQFDTKGVREYTLVNNTEGLYPNVKTFPYPKTGETNSACRVGVVSARGGRTRWLEVPGDPRNHYIATMEWAGNSQELVLQQLNRLQNENRVLMADARTGHVRDLLTEKDDAWVDIQPNGLLWLDGGKRFLWVSERDGWRHVYLVGRDGVAQRKLTDGAVDVIEVNAVDEANGWLYFDASPDNATQRYLYRISLTAPNAQAERVTPKDQPGKHRYEIAPGGQWAIHSYSSFDTPPRTELIRLPQHETVRTLADNADLAAKLKTLRRGSSEFLRLNIGPAELDAWLLKPPDFDPTKKYPLLFEVYGEPAGTTVQDQWGYDTFLWHTMLAQQGYLVASVDNRGTPAPRGRAWRKSVYRKIGTLASEDQAAAARVLCRLPYVDATRIGIWGWSGGGSMSLNMIFRYPDLYALAMAVAPVPNMRLYDTIYQDRYMGLPQDNAEDYKRGSPITYAEHLKGSLLIVHGTGDDNVHYQGTETLINALIAANKPFTMMAYPNRSHGIYEGPNTTRHLFNLLTRYLNTNLPPGPRPK